MSSPVQLTHTSTNPTELEINDQVKPPITTRGLKPVTIGLNPMALDQLSILLLNYNFLLLELSEDVTLIF